ncbi:MAG: DUF3427 domain-containing protein [Succinivibrionaceae bacterium]
MELNNSINFCKNFNHESKILNLVNETNLAYAPQFLYNKRENNLKVANSFEYELEHCQEFIISVAFITQGGVAPFLLKLKELEKKNIPGKILTTDYLHFSEPKALETLASLKNIELKMFCTNKSSGGFHTKGYIFKKEEVYNIIIGSSNWTAGALYLNQEWNTKFTLDLSDNFSKEILSEFKSLWDSDNSKNYVDFIDEYKTKYLKQKIIRKQQETALKEIIVDLPTYKLRPNKMQVEFIANLEKLYNSTVNTEHNKGLLISATGTGKSFASAFAMRQLNAERVLFVVHREQIAKQALKTYKKVFGSSKTYGLISGSDKDYECDFVFSTMQTMSKPFVLEEYDPKYFDVIVLDECHHAGSTGYVRIMDYFKPKFWLGMTASPDTNNYDIYSLFDHNIIYEITLQQALNEDLLCSFHYYGITDIQINGVDVNEEDIKFSDLVSNARIDYILQNAQYYGYSGERVKGVIFCSSVEEAKELSKLFNTRHNPNSGDYYKTIALSGADSQEDREIAIEKLSTNDTLDNNYYDYIFTVDIFNEGVDIPEINQVIMLRPTQSVVVFIQQLGRGLRKHADKEYVVILDFIANYNNNFMIPMALFGDRSYNKDNMRRFIREGNKLISGCSSIHFDEISRKKIYASIDKVKTNNIQIFKDAYKSLKFKIGRIPTIAEFKKYGSIDITKIFLHKKYGSYHKFLQDVEKNNYAVTLTAKQEEIVYYLSSKVALFKRKHELILLRELIAQCTSSFADENTSLCLQYGEVMERNCVKNYANTQNCVYNNLVNNFLGKDVKKKFANCVLISKTRDDWYSLAPDFIQYLNSDKIFLDMVNEIIDFGIDRVEENYADIYKDTNFNLYKKYTYEDVCRLLNWDKNLNGQNIGGYFYDTDTKTFPVFINYEKTEDDIAYEDRFVSENRLIALSKKPRDVGSSDANHIYKRTPKDKDNRIFLFVRKNKDDDEAKEFYFLGEIHAEGEPKPTLVSNDKGKQKAFEICYRLETPVRNDIYDYIVN